MEGVGIDLGAQLSVFFSTNTMIKGNIFLEKSKV